MMEARRSFACLERRPVWRAWICTLLVVLILYNPFLALTSASDALAYQALARHRATVGACEMQHFAAVQEEKTQANADVDVPAGREPAVQQDAMSLLVERKHLPPLKEGLTSVWFRPPPRP